MQPDPLVRERMLTAIRAERPAPLPHPGVAAARATGPSAPSRFTARAHGSATRVVRLAPQESLPALLDTLYPEARRLASVMSGAFAKALDADARWSTAEHPGEGASLATLAAVELAVLQAELGVIENGALWLDEVAMGHRALPFSAEHLVLLLDAHTLVETMHEAYAAVNVPGGFGCFIAGPSKTADIEQSLVIGAQGPRSLTVVAY